MFYYLLHNSSFNKKGELKDRLITTLIYGSVIYIIIHAIINFSNKKNFISYFWFLFVLDCTVFMISNDFNFYTTSMNTLNVKPKEKIKPKINILEQDVSDNESTDTEDIIKNYIKKYSKVSFNENKNEIKEFKKEEPTKKVANKKKKNLKSTNIKKILKKTNSEINNKKEENKIVNNLPVEELNLTLENLENLQLEVNNSNESNFNNSSSIDDIQRDFLKKKMEDEVSDPGSDIDLEQFEKSIINC